MPLIFEFTQIIKNQNLKGDILEFGTGGGVSTQRIAGQYSGGKIHTFDGFVGLPKTNKVIPKGTGWYEGELMFSESETRDRLKYHSNVIVTKCMTWELKEPSEYNINKIAAVNMDLDLYEGTVDALNFMDKCVWDEILVRFDDWGYYEGTDQIKEEVDEHERAAFFEYVKDKGYKYDFYDELNKTTNNAQILVKIYR